MGPHHVAHICLYNFNLQLFLPSSALNCYQEEENRYSVKTYLIKSILISIHFWCYLFSYVFSISSYLCHDNTACPKTSVKSVQLGKTSYVREISKVQSKQKFGCQKNVVRKNFGSKKLLSSIKNESKKELSSNKFWVNKSPSPKKLGSKLFWVPKSKDPKKCGSKTLR